MDTSPRPPRTSSLPARRRNQEGLEAGPYTLRSFFADLPVESSEVAAAHITCVESWEGNLYVGTSASDILHFVKLPDDPSSQEPSEPQFILASRLQPPHSSQGSSVGVQRILLLPPVSKAAVICNNLLTFYSLPEFSPAFNNLKVKDVAWAGVDENDLALKGLVPEGELERDPRGVVMLFGSKKSIRLIRVGDRANLVKDVPFPGSTMCSLRHPIACVADTSKYALIDVNNNQMVPLPPISQTARSPTQTQRPSPPHSPAPPTPPPKSPTTPVPATGKGGHSRTPSLAAPSAESQQSASGDARPSTSHSATIRSEDSSRAPSPKPPTSPSQLVTSGPSAFPTTGQTTLKPHIASPTPTEFLLVTGTEPEEPGVGMFTDLNGDPIMRGTIEFSKYPAEVVIDGGWVVATIEGQNFVECHRWEAEGEGDIVSAPGRHLVNVVDENQTEGSAPGQNGLARIIDTVTHQVPELAKRLKFVRLVLLPKVTAQQTKKAPREPLSTITKTPSPEEDEEGEFDDEEALGTTTEAAAATPADDEAKAEEVAAAAMGSTDAPGELVEFEEWETKRNKEEEAIAKRISVASSKLLLFRGKSIYTMVETPLLIRLDSLLPESILDASTSDLSTILNCWSKVEGVEPTTEVQFHELGYIRQKCGLLLLGICLTSSSEGGVSEEVMGRTKTALSEGGVDPRIVVSMFGMAFRQEIVEGGENGGVWIYNGIKDLVDEFMKKGSSQLATDISSLNFLKKYLQGWRAKKGFGSIADEAHIFSTVDSSLLRVLLLLDSPSSMSPSGLKPSSPTVPTFQRQELYNLVDTGVENFARAVEILEEFDRLYVLSRLYQKMKHPREVLGTWRRILAKGDGCAGGEFLDGELRVKDYLCRLKDASLVEEFGSWLARRNSALGIQVFTDEKSKVKFEPSKVVEILRANAPDAVRGYIEYLVIEKKNVEYANELLHLYLDKIIADIGGSQELREGIQISTETYQALQTPKPTFIEFVADNSQGDEWWRNRLQLLDFLDGDTGYDLQEITKTIEPWKEVLIAETVVLYSKQGMHEDVIKLLCQSLRDYDTAINYCYYCGESVFQSKKRYGTALSASDLKEEQSRLFNILLVEFMNLDGYEDRLEQTCTLLERFGPWLDIQQVLKVIPDSWSIKLFSKFLMSGLRQLVRDKNETSVAKNLSASVLYRLESEALDMIDAAGPTVDSTTAGGGEGGSSNATRQA